MSLVSTVAIWIPDSYDLSQKSPGCADDPRGDGMVSVEAMLYPEKGAGRLRFPIRICVAAARHAPRVITVGEAMAASSATSSGMPTAERIVQIVRELVRETNPELSSQVGAHSSFERDLGLDSLARVELMQRIGKEFGVELAGDALSQADTPTDVLRYLIHAPQLRAAGRGVTLPAAATVGIPESVQTLPEALEWHAVREPQRLHVLLHGDRHDEQLLTYRDLLDAARGIAAGLAQQGLHPRQTVALMLPTGRDYLASFFGVMLAGGIPVPIYPPARPAQLEDHLKRHARILSNAETVLIITVPQAKPVAVMLQAAVPSVAAIVTPGELFAKGPVPDYRPRGSDIAFLQYTSGSTGNPKGVMLTHANLLANIGALGQVVRPRTDEVFVSWLPLYHDMGLIGAWFGSLYYGMPLILMSPLAFLARPALWLQIITRHRGTISAAPNFAYELCLRHIGDADLAQLDLSSWRLALNGAEPVSVATLESFATRFQRCGMRREAITPVYGLAESSVGLAFPPPGRGPRIDVIERDAFIGEQRAIPAAGPDTHTIQLPSCGHALPGHEIRIVDEAGYELPERRIGRLEFRGPSATSGYFRNAEATSALLHDGWLDSGDHAYLAEGEVFITGRVKDLIKRGGRNLYPYDLEEAAGKLPGIRKGCVAVFASPDPAAGTERLVIMAETRERDETARARLRVMLNQAAVDVVGMFADEIVLVPPHTVPKTSSGKLRRLSAREIYESGNATRHAAGPWLHTARLIGASAWAYITVTVRKAVAWLYACYAWSVFCVLALPSGALVALLQRPAVGRCVARFAAQLLFRVTGIPLTAVGIDKLPRDPHVLLVNHASFLDALLLTAVLPPVPGYAFVAKREFLDQTLMRTFMSGLGTVFIERFDVQRSTYDVDLMADALRRGERLLIFPEGTFSRAPGVRPFHVGACLAAARAGVPVVVAGLRGARIALRDGVWRPQRTAITFEIGPTLMPFGHDWAAAVRLTAMARNAMEPLSGEFLLA